MNEGGVTCQSEAPRQPVLGQLDIPAREIAIQKVMNGYIVRCGCKVLVFNDVKIILSEISRYFDNPQAVEKEYIDKYK